MKLSNISKILILYITVFSFLVSYNYVLADTKQDIEQCVQAGYTSLGGCKLSESGESSWCEPTIYTADKIKPIITCEGCPTYKLCCQKPEDPNNTAVLAPRVPGCIEKIPDAQTTPPEPIYFKPSVTIPGTIFTAGKEIEITGESFAQYVSGFYKFFVGFMVVVAVVMIMWGGFKRIMAAGSAEKTKDANDTIFAAIIGLVITLISYTLLNLINPQLVNLKTLAIQSIKAEEFSIRPGILENPGLKSTADEYKIMSCPSSAELLAGVKFFTTGYYKPNFEDKERYQSFWCNIAMQCSCPNGREVEYSCQSGTMKWQPCKKFNNDVPYCNAAAEMRTPPPPPGQTTPTKTPEPWVTVAQKGCNMTGTVLKVFGSKQDGVNTAVWYVHDTGGAITGRRIDLYFGQGPSAYQQAVKSTGIVTVKKCPDNDISKCPSL